MLKLQRRVVYKPSCPDALRQPSLSQPRFKEKEEGKMEEGPHLLPLRLYLLICTSHFTHAVSQNSVTCQYLIDKVLESIVLFQVTICLPDNCCLYCHMKNSEWALGDTRLFPVLCTVVHSPSVPFYYKSQVTSHSSIINQFRCVSLLESLS